MVIPWHPHADVWLLVFALLTGYFIALRVWGPRAVPLGGPPATTRQKAAFLSGLAAMWLAADWPAHELSENYLYSVHMVQHLVFTLVVPPLLLAGTPAWLARKILSPLSVLTVARAVTRPLPALVIFNVVLAFNHWPTVVKASVTSEPIHLLLHILIFVSALIMWTPILSPLLELPRLSYPGRMFFLFLQSLVPTVPASFLTFADAPLYKIYESFPRLFGISALSDQRVAGLIMKIGGGFILWGFITVFFFKWHAQEESTGLDALAWRDVDRELNRVRLSK